jgi:hypothetical protein
LLDCHVNTFERLDRIDRQDDWTIVRTTERPRRERTRVKQMNGG